MYNRKQFNLDDRRIILASCRNMNAPAIACKVELRDFPELDSLMLYFPMETDQVAWDWVERADVASAQLKCQSIMDEHRAILDMFNRCLSAPMPPAWKLQGKR